MLAHDPYDGARHPDQGDYRDDVDAADRADYFDPADGYGDAVPRSNPDALDELQAACRRG